MCHHGDLSRLTFHLDLLLSAEVQRPPCHPLLWGSRVEPRLPPPGCLHQENRLWSPHRRRGGAGWGGTRRRGGRQVGRRRSPDPHLMQSPFRKPARSPGSPGKRFRACSRHRVPTGSPVFPTSDCSREKSRSHPPASREGPAKEHPAAAWRKLPQLFPGRTKGDGRAGFERPFAPSCVQPPFSSVPERDV